MSQIVYNEIKYFDLDKQIPRLTNYNLIFFLFLFNSMQIKK